MMLSAPGQTKLCVPAALSSSPDDVPQTWRRAWRPLPWRPPLMIGKCEVATGTCSSRRSMSVVGDGGEAEVSAKRWRARGKSKTLSWQTTVLFLVVLCSACGAAVLSGIVRADREGLVGTCVWTVASRFLFFLLHMLSLSAAVAMSVYPCVALRNAIALLMSQLRVLQYRMCSSSQRWVRAAFTMLSCLSRRSAADFGETIVEECMSGAEKAFAEVAPSLIEEQALNSISTAGVSLHSNTAFSQCLGEDRSFCRQLVSDMLREITATSTSTCVEDRLLSRQCVSHLQPSIQTSFVEAAVEEFSSCAGSSGSSPISAAQRRDLMTGACQNQAGSKSTKCMTSLAANPLGSVLDTCTTSVPVLAPLEPVEMTDQDVVRRGQGAPVFLHVYDVSNQICIQKLNKLLAHTHSPFKFGGLFHAS